ncbi:SIS domain-containing protein [Candidatus Neomarinimicrobiota bacterium]
MEDLGAILEQHLEMVESLDPILNNVDKASRRIVSCLASGGKVLFMGNCGSAAESQHLAAELVGRSKMERRGLPAIALSTDTSIITAIANDYDLEHVFSRQIEAICHPEDVVVGISTSGNSPNVLKGIEKAKEIGANTIGLIGNDGGELGKMVNLSITVPVKDTARIQEGHMIIGHMICEWVDSSELK